MNYLGLTVSILILLSIASYSKARTFFNQELGYHVQEFSLEQYHHLQAERATKAYKNHSAGKSHSNIDDNDDAENDPPKEGALYPKFNELKLLGKDGFRKAGEILLKHHYQNAKQVKGKQYLLMPLLDLLMEKSSAHTFKANERLHSALNNLKLFDTVNGQPSPQNLELLSLFSDLLKGDTEHLTPLNKILGLTENGILYIRLNKTSLDIIENQ
ncbi:MAG: hypothetical protein ACI9S8_000266 [Chlamydiales bacterium]|jgi:hypothetical protein